MTIKIVLPKPKDIGPSCFNMAQTGVGTGIFNHEGQEIKNISSLDMHISPDAIITATIEVAVSGLSEMDNIHALLGSKTLKEIADLHGYDLVPKPIVSIKDGETRYNSLPIE